MSRFDLTMRGLSMSTNTLPVTETKQRFTELVKAPEQMYDRYLITRNGKRAPVIMSAGECNSLLETIGVLANRRELRALKEAVGQVRRRETIAFDIYLSKKKNLSIRRKKR